MFEKDCWLLFSFHKTHFFMLKFYTFFHYIWNLKISPSTSVMPNPTMKEPTAIFSSLWLSFQNFTGLSSTWTIDVYFSVWSQARFCCFWRCIMEIKLRTTCLNAWPSSASSAAWPSGLRCWHTMIEKSWLNPRPCHVIASLNKTSYNAYSPLGGTKASSELSGWDFKQQPETG